MYINVYVSAYIHYMYLSVYTDREPRHLSFIYRMVADRDRNVSNAADVGRRGRDVSGRGREGGMALACSLNVDLSSLTQRVVTKSRRVVGRKSHQFFTANIGDD